MDLIQQLKVGQSWSKCALLCGLIHQSAQKLRDPLCSPPQTDLCSVITVMMLHQLNNETILIQNAGFCFCLLDTFKTFILFQSDFPTLSITSSLSLGLQGGSISKLGAEIAFKDLVTNFFGENCAVLIWTTISIYCFREKSPTVDTLWRDRCCIVLLPLPGDTSLLVLIARRFLWCPFIKKNACSPSSG